MSQCDAPMDSARGRYGRRQTRSGKRRRKRSSAECRGIFQLLCRPSVITQSSMLDPQGNIATWTGSAENQAIRPLRDHRTTYFHTDPETKSKTGSRSAS